MEINKPVAGRRRREDPTERKEGGDLEKFLFVRFWEAKETDKIKFSTVYDIFLMGGVQLHCLTRLSRRWRNYYFFSER